MRYNACNAQTTEGTTMNAIRGTIQDGKVVFHTPPDLPEGTPVAVSPLTPGANAIDDLSDDNDTGPEAIAKRLALMDRVQPWMTPEEYAEWERMRAEDKAFQLSQWEKWSKESEGTFQ